MDKTTVLIVEDEEIVAADLASKLRQLGYAVVGSAAEGEEAIAMACSLKPQVVLMDIRLYGPMDGIEAAEAIRHRYDVPVIYLTSHSDPGTLERAKVTEPFGYILKPFEERELATTIEMALYKHLSERTLREQREWLRVTLASIGDAVITCDTDGRVTFLNSVAETLTGWCIEEARERQIQEVFSLINEQTHQPPENPIAFVLREGQCKVLGNHTAIITRDGREIPIEDSAAPILDADGRVIGAVLVFHDVTDKRRAQEALGKAKKAAEAANLAKSQFLANMSHELRTPMTGVLGMLDIVLLGNLEEEQRESIETAQTAARSLVRVLNDILDMTKIEAGKFSIEEKPFSPRKCVENTFNILLPVAKSKGLHLNLTMADDVPETLVGDQLRLNQVLTNLAGNAVKFTEKGRVEISVASCGIKPDGKRAITFSVADTGIGIPADKQKLIFQYFTQVDQSHTRIYGGTGLGLAISKEIVERMEGTITFTSEEGKGSIFTCSIPLGEAEPDCVSFFASENTSMEVDAPCAEVIKKPRLLVAEDDQITRKILGTLLQMAKYETDFAENGQKVVEMWESGKYDLILMDVQMPLLNGFEATAAIREKERSYGVHIPIVAMTAHALKEDEERCLAAGMNAYISKPIDLKECLQRIGETLKKAGDAQ
jgi:PAS domain S-box-containing protein